MDENKKFIEHDIKTINTTVVGLKILKENTGDKFATKQTLEVAIAYLETYRSELSNKISECE